ncbi:MAG TPA: S8 family serine peptidase, partial [Anaerolineae bacterium]|nr:S8 family serine peptidase [Anaerolineae bacterium]
MKSVLKHWHRVLMLAALLAALWPTGVMTAPVGDEKIPPAAEVARTAALVCKEGHCSTSEVPAPNMAQPEVADGEGLLRLRAGAFDPALGEPVMTPALMRALDNAQTGLRLVQFPGPIQEAWYAALEASGLHIITYIPDYAYLVWGNGAAVETVRMAAPLAWAGDYHPFYALHPDLTQVDRLPERVKVTVQVYAHSEAAIVIKDILARATVIQEPHPSLVYQNMKIEIAATDLTWLAALPGVVNVEPALEYQMMDEIQGQIMAGNLNAAGTRPAGTGYLTWLTWLGFPTDPANYPIVDVTDDGIDDGDATPLHTDFYEFGSTSNPDRLIYNYNGTTDASADGGGGHGNLNASIVAGYNTTTGYPYEDASGYNYGLGINPYGRVAGSKVFRNSGSWDYPGSNAALIGNSYTLGARISSNSWGANTGGGYTIDCQEYDALVRDALSGTGGNQEMIIVFSAGNAGSSGSNTIGSPGAAKNVITVGASENYRPLDTDGCSIGPTGANNVQDIINFSSRGPTDDSRIKPDVVAPGTHVMGAASKSPNFDGSGVCGPASGLYYPTSPAQTLYTWSSGTSHSTPAVAGAASLIYYYHQTHFGGAAPSPALMKAYLIHATTYMTGVNANDTLPSNSQGYGLVNLDRAFDTLGRYVEDQGQTFGATGETYAYYGNVEDSGEPVRVVLAWTDAPGSTTGNAYVNNLNLTVQISGETYLGNVFSGGASTTGGTADARNNVESVFLPAGFSGAFTVTVGAANIAGDGVPGNADTTDQDFALLVYNTSNRSDLVGYIAGTVTDSSTSATIANARVSVYFSTLTGADGKYRLAVISGTHTVTAQGYGYIPASATGVVVTTGMTTTQDFTLLPAPSYILTGTVTDASTGWALYASVEITPDGYPAFTVWTNPWTGVYSVTLAGSYPHTLTVEPWSGIPGYVGQSRQVNLSANRYNENFALAAGAPACNAPGYTRVGLNEGFESATFPPTGWASFRGANGLGTGYDWVRTTTAYAGSGAAYVRYEDVTGGLAQDWLVTPQVHPTAGNSLLSFYMRQHYPSDWNTTYTIRVSTGSQTTHADFTTVRTYTETDFGLTYQPFTVDLSAYVDQDIYIAFVM